MQIPMQLVVKQTDTSPLNPLLFGAVGFAGIAAYFYFATGMRSMSVVFAAFAVLALLGSFWVTTQETPVLVIDETGLFDARNGIGKIWWHDVVEVHIEASYGNRFLCLRVKNPEEYVSKLNGPVKERVNFNRSLGFRRINVDIGDLNVSLLDLKKMIEARIPYPSDING